VLPNNNYDKVYDKEEEMCKASAMNCGPVNAEL
jgi:hypothetical protein